MNHRFCDLLRISSRNNWSYNSVIILKTKLLQNKYSQEIHLLISALNSLGIRKLHLPLHLTSEQLIKLRGIRSFFSPFFCRKEVQRTHITGFPSVWNKIYQLTEMARNWCSVNKIKIRKILKCYNATSCKVLWETSENKGNNTVLIYLPRYRPL